MLLGSAFTGAPVESDPGGTTEGRLSVMPAEAGAGHPQLELNRGVMIHDHTAVENGGTSLRFQRRSHPPFGTFGLSSRDSRARMDPIAAARR